CRFALRQFSTGAACCAQAWCPAGASRYPNVRSAECKLLARWPEPTSAEKAAASSRTPNRGTPQQLTPGSQSFSDLCFFGAFWYRFHSSNEWQFPWRSHETSDLCDDQWQAA